MVAAGGRVTRSGAPRATHYGVACLRRVFGSESLDAEQVVFAPARPRPLLLGLTRLRNPGAQPLALEYTERWDLPTPGAHARPGDGASEIDTPAGPRALADLSAVIRTRAVDPPPAGGLALEVRLLLPPGAERVFSFGYAAPAADDYAPGVLARAWRGDVAGELGRTLAWWREHGAPAVAPESPVVAYRQKVSESPDARPEPGAG